MARNIILAVMLFAASPALLAANTVAAAENAYWEPLLDVAFEKNDLEMAALILINDNNIPVSDVIQKARDMGFYYTRIVNALIDTKLSCEQVMVDALQNNVPPTALFESSKIRDDYNYTPDLILRFLVKELRFMQLTEEHLGEKDENIEAKKKNIEIIIRVCRAMMDDEDFSQYDVMLNLCLAEAGNELISETVRRFDVPLATTIKACPKHAEYGHAYISHDLPQEAYIIIGVDHQTLDDNAGRGTNVISPMRP